VSASLFQHDEAIMLGRGMASGGAL
jgi:hypothetical protein